MRHDNPKFDLKISQINAEIEKFVLGLNSERVKLLPFHELPRDLFTTHGLHLNKKGKAKIAVMISKLLLPNQPMAVERTSREADTPEVIILSDTENSNQPSLSGSTALPTTLSPSPKNAILVIEADIKNIFEKYSKDSSVALAHSISADFEDSKHMSAGIAVAFRETFGRPKASDLIDSHLACQKMSDGPTIYSLVTKSRYFGKPTLTNYNTAFTQLLKDFKSKGFKSLICSAVGCVRDNIQPHHFIQNIVRFHQESGASVQIISYDQTARRSLWNGLTHSEFLKTLRVRIENQLNTAAKRSTDIEPSVTVTPAADSTATVLATPTAAVTPPSTPACGSPRSQHPSSSSESTPQLHLQSAVSSDQSQSCEKSGDCTNSAEMRKDVFLTDCLLGIQLT